MIVLQSCSGFSGILDQGEPRSHGDAIQQKEKLMDNTTEHENHVWNGTGEYFPKLQVRHLFDNEYRVIATSNPPSKWTDINDIITADSFEKAIYYIRSCDCSYFDEATLYAEEGG